MTKEALESRVDRLAQEVDFLSEKVTGIAQVCAAVADDMLRACFVLDEMSNAGLIPSPLPWGLGTKLVELQHALQAQANRDQTENGDPIEKRVDQLRIEVAKLRKELARNNYG